MANARKKLETWLRASGYVTSRNGIDFDRAADALGIGRRSMIRYLNGDAEVPSYLSMLVDAREAYMAERAIIVTFKPLKSNPGRGAVTITVVQDEAPDDDGDHCSIEELVSATKMTFVDAMERAKDEALKRGCEVHCKFQG